MASDSNRPASSKDDELKRKIGEKNRTPKTKSFRGGKR